MSDLTILVPTRGRPQSVGRLVDAFVETGAFNDRVRLVFGYDLDDQYAESYADEIGRHAGELVLSQVFDTRLPMVPKLNIMAAAHAPRCEFIGFMGDDHRPRTVDWHNKFVGTLCLAPGRTGIVYGRDGLQDRSLSTYWVMSSNLVGALGQRMVPADVEHLYCDNAIKALGLAVKCIWYRDDVLVEHMHFLNGKSPMDPQYALVNSAQQYDRDGMAFEEWERNKLSAQAETVRFLIRELTHGGRSKLRDS